MEERSLDEFLEGDDDAAQSPPETATAGEGETDNGDTEPETDETEIEPATATSRVIPEGENCDSCGESVSRLWMGDSGELCQSCVEW